MAASRKLKTTEAPADSSEKKPEKALVKLRVGRIQYLNVLPFFHGLVPDLASNCLVCHKPHAPLDFGFHEHPPVALNQMMLAGRLDVAPISSFAYLLNQKDYLLLPDLGIGSRDFSGSVILFSNQPIEGLNQKTIAVTSESASSVMLLKILLRFKYKFSNKFVVTKPDAEAMLEKYQTALMIGDTALFYKPQSFVYRYDLSELWWNWTGKPFCFALWAVRRSVAERYGAEVRCFAKRVRDQREINLVNIETLLKESLGMDFMNPRFSKLFGYFFNLIFGFDEAMGEGLELFYRLAHRYGAVDRPQPLEFLNL